MAYTHTDDVPEVAVNEPKPLAGRIAWHIENALSRVAKNVFNAVSNSIVTVIELGLDKFLERIEPSILDITSPVLREMRDVPGMPESTKESINNILSGKHQSGGPLAILFAVAGILGTASGPMSIMSRRSQHFVDATYRTNIPTPDALWAMVRRGELDASSFRTYMEESGWSDELIQGWQSITKSLIPPLDLGRAVLRDFIPMEEYHEELRKRGYTVSDADTIVKLLSQIPTAQDLVRMAVREAWNDDAARTFGYDQDFPPEFAEWAEKLGYDQDWAKRFWRAHWELPGVRDGFEMLHRRIIDKGELELLLRVKDIPDFWRKRLIQLSYRPLNRVDVRRMYRDGVLDETAVYNAYLDLGYNDENATSLTQWTIKAYNADGRELAKGDVLSAYRDGTITRQEATEYLFSLEYGEDEVNVLLSRVDIKKEEEYEKEVIANVRVSFVAGVIEENDVISQLNALNPPAGFVEERLRIWRLQKARSVKRPTLAALKTFWQGDVIDDTTLTTELVNLGYSSKYIEWYKELWEGSE